MAFMEKIKVADLKENAEVSALIPEMTEEEFDELLESIKEEGVRMPIDINANNDILDGRHRVRAAVQLGIEELLAIRHEFTDEEAIKFVCDTATKRRNLTPEQKYEVISKTKGIIEEIRKKARKRQSEAAQKTNKKKKNKNDTLSTDRSKAQKEEAPNIQTKEKSPYNSNREIAKMTGMSKSQVERIKRVQKYDPEMYEKVLDGEIKTSTADEMIKLKRKRPDLYEKVKEKEMTLTAAIEENKRVEKSNLKQTKPKKEEEKAHSSHSGDVTEDYEFTEEYKKKKFEARKLTFRDKVEDLVGYMYWIDNIEEVMTAACEEDYEFFQACLPDLERIIRFIKKPKLRRIK